MKYDEWLILLKKLEKTSNQEDINKINNEPYNDNINALLKPKIRDMIITKCNHSIDLIVEGLETIFTDENELDLALVTLKKNVKVIDQLINNNQFQLEDKQKLRKQIRDGIDRAYDVLYEAAFDASDDGVYNSIIKKNRIKWSDENELSGD